MLKNLSILALSLTFLTSCQSAKKGMGANQDQFNIENQIVEEQYQTIDDANQAEALSEKTEDLDSASGAVEVQDRVFFGYNASDVTPEAAKILDVQASWLNDNPKIRITIEGHCDVRGTREYNISLGEKRAMAAKNYLTSKGVDSARIKTISYGKERPAYFGTTEDVHSKNRRAVVVVN